MTVRRTLQAGCAAALILTPVAAVPQRAGPQAPGTLISAEPMSGAPAGADAWRIRYVSRNDSGAPEEVTGVVVAPRGAAPAGGRPVIAWAHGTWGVAEKCAPSTGNFFGATPGLNAALARGYVFVATDYAGLGTPQPHPYLVGASAAHSMLDSVRAARQVSGADAGQSFAAWGESQGAHAALFAGELARDYAPELKLVGIAAAAPPTDLVANLTGGADPSVRAFLTAFTADSWSRHFRIPLSTIGRPATARLIGRLAQNCLTIGKKPKLGTVVGILALRRDLRGVDLGKIQPWARIARENSAGQRAPGGPLFIAQNSKDVIVSPTVTHAFARRLCTRGARVRYMTMATPGGHVTSAADSAIATLDWIGGRFAGAPAPSDCGRF
ncbi:MAG: lipase family protein [Sphingomonas sp.]|uniref:lipase family protein n=1 Tax=Sphingomonas sp. TaxID=28214 RepID=UPI00356741F6